MQYLQLVRFVEWINETMTTKGRTKISDPGDQVHAFLIDKFLNNANIVVI
jgi:hypothetical protein